MRSYGVDLLTASKPHWADCRHSQRVTAPSRTRLQTNSDRDATSTIYFAPRSVLGSRSKDSQNSRKNFDIAREGNQFKIDGRNEISAVPIILISERSINEVVVKRHDAATRIAKRAPAGCSKVCKGARFILGSFYEEFYPFAAGSAPWNQSVQIFGRRFSDAPGEGLDASGPVWRTRS